MYVHMNIFRNIHTNICTLCTTICNYKYIPTYIRVYVHKYTHTDHMYGKINCTFHPIWHFIERVSRLPFMLCICIADLFYLFISIFRIMATRFFIATIIHEIQSKTHTYIHTCIHTHAYALSVWRVLLIIVW